MTPVSGRWLNAPRRRTGVTLLLCAVCAACGTTPPVVSKPLPSPVVSHEADHLDPKILAEVNTDESAAAYQVGAGDSLLVAVYGHPELAISQYAGMGIPGGRGNGFVIDNDGSIQFPLIGSVNVAGKTLNELRIHLEDQLKTYVREPKVTVQVLFNGSLRYYLLGQFTAPGLKYADRPMRLLEALSLGGSIIMDKASLREAYVARGNKRLPINFRSLIREGNLRYNIPLRNGDIVFVPDSAADQAFVFKGGNSGSTGGAVPFINGRLDLIQALAQAGFGFTERSQGVLSETHVLRSEGDRGELFIVDVERILDGDAANFQLAPGDVIFVPTSAFTDWNLALEQLLPTLQTVSTLLTPFVQIKFLQQK
jgi:polysaccharide export outer membrane protein